MEIKLNIHQVRSNKRVQFCGFILGYLCHVKIISFEKIRYFDANKVKIKYRNTVIILLFAMPMLEYILQTDIRF